MITLFHRPRTRSTRFIFLLEELQAPYQIHIVTTRNRDGSGAVDPANPHPHGKVPAISDDGVIVFESPAIALYLTDRYPRNRIGPLPAQAERGAYLTWLAYYTGVLEPAFVSKFMNVEVPRGTAGWVAVEEVMPFVIQRLSQGPYLLGHGAGRRLTPLQCARRSAPPLRLRVTGAGRRRCLREWCSARVRMP